MSREKTNEKIIRKCVGEMPLIKTVASRLKIKEILSGYIPTHKNETIPALDSLIFLLFNMTNSRQPLYELEEWLLKKDSHIFGFEKFDEGIFNDDRFGRALDKLYLADRASLMTEIVTNTIKTMNLDLSRIHNDSTSVKAFGKIPGTTYTGLCLKRGKSKDHRPDLKQLVFSLTISSDGAVPIHYKTYPGNRTDDTTHIETWETVAKISNRKDFLYVADCKVCTDKQLSHIVGQGGRVLTLIPDTWTDNQAFRDELRLRKKRKKGIWRRKIPGQYNEYETFSCFTEDTQTSKRGYKIHWIYSSEKKKNDQERREVFLQKAERKLREISVKLNSRNLKTKEQILERAYKILHQYKMKDFFSIDVLETKEQSTIRIGKGRPGPNTKYKTIINAIYSLAWKRNKQALRQEKNVDGIFPLLCTDGTLTAKDALMAYKYQPRLEKRFTQFKDIHNAAPLLFKKIERVEAIMFLFFLALMIQSVIEREVRIKMKEKEIDTLPIYPEHRLSYHPTTAKIFERFDGISTYKLTRGTEVIKEFKDELSPIHLKILELLKISEKDFWSRN